MRLIAVAALIGLAGCVTAPVPTPAQADAQGVIGPPAPTQPGPAKRAMESPAVVGGAVSTLAVAALSTWAHVTPTAPVAAAIAVLGTFVAEYLETQ